MEILKHGKKFDKNRIVTCEKCKCKFEYDNSDSIIEKGFTFTTNIPVWGTYIRCPECKMKMLVNFRFLD